MRRLMIVGALLFALSVAPSATTCLAPNNIPAGAVVTPGCTYIVEQVDPGVWRDNLNRIWVWVSGLSTAVSVQLEDLHIGRWLTGR